MGPFRPELGDSSIVQDGVDYACPASPSASVPIRLIKVLRGRFRDVSWMVYTLTALFIARFYYLGAG
jgi:hypothetical protein